jgi:hypothetical protein
MFRNIRIGRIGYSKAVSTWQAQDCFSFHFWQNLHASQSPINRTPPHRYLFNGIGRFAELLL